MDRNRLMYSCTTKKEKKWIYQHFWRNRRQFVGVTEEKKLIKSHSGMMTRRFDLQFFPPPPYQGNIYHHPEEDLFVQAKMEDTMQIIWNSLNPFCGFFGRCIVIGLNTLSSDIMAKSGP